MTDETTTDTFPCGCARTSGPAEVGTFETIDPCPDHRGQVVNDQTP